ncbi:HAD-IA family hydrolase [Hephaestia sp. GCM10023244]|uniref:HAD-IA family hydrolase n=1 Tax=unclassified Hephaestia TaxID=2631281 RepID=UPI0020771F51|nr:HAD-IA family hydrolase [Hephaestia sp. MAHUQ-44]MCM8729660.1 HAD-IA family hydrolase [Hephaestia sp. MAHUQ-44]
MNRLAIFDCDGTLVDSQINICRSVEQAFAAHRIAPPPRVAIRRIVGLSLIEAMAVLLPEAQADDHIRLAETYKHIFSTLRANGGLAEEPLFDGVAEALDVLEAEGWLLGVATGKSDRGLAHILATHGLSARFVTLQTADRHPSKPHPSMLEAAIAEAGAAPDTSVMIGDTSFDMAMARAAGTRAVGVAWGYHARDELTAAGAHAIAETAAHLAPCMEAA